MPPPRRRPESDTARTQIKAGPRPDPRTLAILQELKARLRKRFGDRVVRLYLFGSRARGDHEPDSDADVAVIFRGRIRDPFDLQRQIIEDTYELLLEHDLYIQPWPLEEGCLEDPDAHPRPQLARAVLREGIRL